MARSVKSEREGAKTEQVQKVDRCLFALLMLIRERKAACDTLGHEGESKKHAIMEGLAMQARDDLFEMVPAYQRAEAA